MKLVQTKESDEGKYDLTLQSDLFGNQTISFYIVASFDNATKFIAICAGGFLFVLCCIATMFIVSDMPLKKYRDNGNKMAVSTL